MNDVSTVEQPATVSEDLAAAWQDFESGEADELGDVIESEIDHSGESGEGDPAEPAEGIADAGEERSADAIEALQAPENWSQEDRDTFTALAELEDKGLSAQQFLLNRHKAMEGDYTRKMQELAPLKQYQAIDQIFAPYADQLKETNQTPASVITHWASIDKSLSDNPVETLHWLASQYGVNLAEAAEQTPNPQVMELSQQVNQLKQQIGEKERLQQEESYNAYYNKIEEFSQEKTEAGELAHPYFEEVHADMAKLAQIDRAEGKEPELSDLYERAVYMNPSVREKHLSAQREAAEAKRLEDARQKAAKAKKASRTVGGTPSGDSPSADMSLREELEQAFG